VSNIPYRQHTVRVTQGEFVHEWTCNSQGTIGTPLRRKVHSLVKAKVVFDEMQPGPFRIALIDDLTQEVVDEEEHSAWDKEAYLKPAGKTRKSADFTCDKAPPNKVKRPKRPTGRGNNK
jgi:hypothetical protein